MYKYPLKNKKFLKKTILANRSLWKKAIRIEAELRLKI